MWIIFAILNPFSEAFKNLFSKKAAIKKVPSLYLSWVNNLIPTFIFLPFAFFIDFNFNQEFFIALFFSGILNVVAIILYMKAISEGDISQVIPILSFTPLFLLVTSPVILGELPNLQGIIGVLFIVSGSYLLNINLQNQGIFAPLKALVKNKGTRYMMIVSFIYSFSANFDKMAIQSSSMWQYLIFINIFMLTGSTLTLLFKEKFDLKLVNENKRNLFVIGFFNFLTNILHATALSLTFVVYVIALKRTSGLMSIGLGSIFLKEKNIKERFLGASVMFVGVLLIILS